MYRYSLSPLLPKQTTGRRKGCSNNGEYYKSGDPKNQDRVNFWIPQTTLGFSNSFTESPIKKTAGLLAASSYTHIHEAPKERCWGILQGTELAPNISKLMLKMKIKPRKLASCLVTYLLHWYVAFLFSSPPSPIFCCYSCFDFTKW